MTNCIMYKAIVYDIENVDEMRTLLYRVISDHVYTEDNLKSNTLAVLDRLHTAAVDNGKPVSGNETPMHDMTMRQEMAMHYLAEYSTKSKYNHVEAAINAVAAVDALIEALEE